MKKSRSLLGGTACLLCLIAHPVIANPFNDEPVSAELNTLMNQMESIQSDLRESLRERSDMKVELERLRNKVNKATQGNEEGGEGMPGSVDLPEPPLVKAPASSGSPGITPVGQFGGEYYVRFETGVDSSDFIKVSKEEYESYLVNQENMMDRLAAQRQAVKNTNDDEGDN